MELHCPKCDKPIAYQQKDFSNATHHEHVCPHCQEFLRDELPVPNSNTFGPPRKCDHPASRRTRPTGLVPYFKRTSN